MINSSNRFKEGLGKVNTLNVVVKIASSSEDNVYFCDKNIPGTLPAGSYFENRSLKVSNIKESIDIDNEQDFEYSNFLINKSILIGASTRTTCSP